MNTMKDFLLKQLTLRKERGLLRTLAPESNLYDFSSNDYLGLARSAALKQMISNELEQYPAHTNGSTGSRLLSGNSAYIEQLEQEIAGYHGTENGLIFSTGYNANLALFSSVPQKGDTVICDELIHASVIDGARLSYAVRRKFRHNDLVDLERQLKQAGGKVFVAVESVYSMDGDLGDLINIAKLCLDYGAQLIVDEAHAFGIWGTGLIDLLQMQDYVFARVVTFSKAMGLHGAIVLGTAPLKDYLVNFARSFIFSTAPPFPFFAAIRTGYRYLLANPQLPEILRKKACLFKSHMQSQVPSSINPTPIQIVMISGNEEVTKMSSLLREKGFDVAAIRSPTVPVGKERLRISIHCHNSDEEILLLCKYLNELTNCSHEQ